MTFKRLILPALCAAATFSLALPSAAQTAATAPDPTVTPPAVAAPAPRMTSTLRVRDVGRVPEMGLCRGGCDESATARRGTFTIQMPCPDGLTITPFGTCVRIR
ncbi:MAG: hypothetical protein AAF366_04425 [Pseudomonadota bacterium]